MERGLVLISHQTATPSLPYLFGVVVYHARRVINSQTNLILAFTGLGPSEPNLIFSKLTRNVRNDLPHVQSLPRSVVSSIKCTQMRQRLVHCSSLQNFFKE